MATIARVPSQALLAGIVVYQWLISPWLGQRCRFYPSCSHYAIEALNKYGATRGVWLTTKRLLKCHPWHPGGNDKVP